jgi:DNA-binding CsgD family transcriptional regulator
MRRRNLHRALAEARSRLCPDEPEAIARHWREADVRHEAFVWAIAAGRAAVDRGAPPEAADWFESALADWERILSAETVAGMAYFDLVRLAEFAMVRSRQFDRAAAILVRALESPDRLVPGEESMAWFFLSLHIGLSGDKGVWPFSAREALERARLSLSEATPDLLRLIVLSSYIVNVLLCFADEVAAGKAWADAERMIDRVPGQIPPIVVAARACLLSYQGCSEASAAIAACEAPDIVAIRRDGPESWLRPMLGAHEENVRACAEGIERAIRERNLSVAGFTLFSSMSLSLTALGRWQEALDAWRILRAEVSDDVLLDGRQTVLRGWGPLFVRTANHDLLQPYLAQDPNRGNNGPPHHLPTEALVEVELARTRGDWQHAASNIEHLLASLHGRVLFAQAAQAVSWAVTALADAAFSRTIDPDTATEMAGRWIRRLESGLNTNQRRPGEHDAVDYLAQAEAERLRIRGDDSSDNWRALADAWASAGRPFNEAYARFRLAFHLLTAQPGHPMRTRALARQELRRAAELAEALGASLLSSDVRSLALSAGISLTGRRAQRLEVTRSPQTAAALTPRERQVARLLSEGLTNGQIGLTLGMSPKTASVHVGNIMDKLGAANRVQAAILIRTNGPVATAKAN